MGNDLQLYGINYFFLSETNNIYRVSISPKDEGILCQEVRLYLYFCVVVLRFLCSRLYNIKYLYLIQLIC